MKGGDQDERYDSFDDYSFNYDTFKRIQGEIVDDVDSFPSGVLIEQTEHTFTITNDCLRIRKYLKNFRSKEECQEKNCCLYINFFLNKLVREQYNSQRSIFDTYNNYMKDVSNTDIKSLCMSKINYMENHKYQKIKELYTAFALYKIFSSKNHTPLCYTAKSCANTYNKIITTYYELDDTKFCKALNDFKKVFEANVNISTRKCGDDIPNLLSYPDKCTNPQEVLEHDDTDFEHQDRSLLTRDTLKRSLAREEQQQISGMREDHAMLPSSLSSTLPITLFSSGISVLLILLSLYKFTPFGHWLRLQTQKFKGISGNLEREEYEVQQHNSEYDDIIAEYDGYNISYNSL
ncbi:PIR Superfamily Protein [Plasmodium ovale curtisi]|uniref:PIR Superfamily Protein n=1 Tax=Plasmodium ovale curtisi TaxID=864141 RepID=A0A1A8WLW6_PLAOA|nr:PIR Superfamily Protein [Plasmodium ovale curtisi]SBT02062.1 PIR Superfamily Protein [Plasmodium ovale curtisi]